MICHGLLSLQVNPALTIAKMPAPIAFGSSGHAVTMAARSGSTLQASFGQGSANAGFRRRNRFPDMVLPSGWSRTADPLENEDRRACLWPQITESAGPSYQSPGPNWPGVIGGTMRGSAHRFFLELATTLPRQGGAIFGPRQCSPSTSGILIHLTGSSSKAARSPKEPR